MHILKYPDPFLRLTATKLPTQDELPGVVSEMTSVMLSHNGIGLAATQVGLDLRLFILKMPDKDKVWVCVDPKIVRADTRTRVIEEGCLSMPGLLADVERPSRIQVEFTDETGKMVKYGLAGLMACAFQHELDHLNGVLFIDRMPEGEKSKLLARYELAKEGGNGMLG